MQLWTPSSARVYTLLMAPNCFPSGWGKLNSIANGFKVCFLNSRSPSTLSRTGSPICLLLLATLSIEYYACPVPNFGLLRFVPIFFFFFSLVAPKGGLSKPNGLLGLPPTNLDYKYNLVWVPMSSTDKVSYCPIRDMNSNPAYTKINWFGLMIKNNHHGASTPKLIGVSSWNRRHIFKSYFIY